MTRRGVISIHDYPEHLNPFREDDEELPWGYSRKERASVSVVSRLTSPSKSPAKPERPPLPHRTKHKNKENEVASPDEDKYFRQGAKPKKKRPAPMPPSPNQQKMTPAVSDGSLNSTNSTSTNAVEALEITASPAKKIPIESNGTQPQEGKDTPIQNGEHEADIPSETKTPSKQQEEELSKTIDSEEGTEVVSKPQSDQLKSNGVEKVVEEEKCLPEEEIQREDAKSSPEVIHPHKEAKSSEDVTESLSPETVTSAGESQSTEEKSSLEEGKSFVEIQSTPETVSSGEVRTEETKPRDDAESSHKDSGPEDTEDAGRLSDESPPPVDESINTQEKTTDSKQQEAESKEKSTPDSEPVSKEMECV